MRKGAWERGPEVQSGESCHLKLHAVEGLLEKVPLGRDKVSSGSCGQEPSGLRELECKDPGKEHACCSLGTVRRPMWLEQVKRKKKNRADSEN